MPEVSPQPNVVGSGSLRALSPLFWGLIVLTGVGAGLAGGLLLRLLHAVQHLSWPYHAGDDFLAAVEASSPIRIILIVTAAGLIAGLVQFILKQERPGGHGGELAERIWFGAGELAPVRTLVRAVTSIVIVGMGAALGREAAPKQTGALIAGLLAQWASIPGARRRLLVACGAGAGIAAVYNVPFGGAIFALEVLLGTLALPLVAPALAASLIATSVSWLLVPNVPTYHVPFYPVRQDEWIWAALAGPVIGVAAALYVRLISWVDALRPRRTLTLGAPVLVFLCLGGAAVFCPQLLGNGKDVVQQAFLGRVGLMLLAVLVVLRPIATAACPGSGAPGGLFTPTMTLGAVLGGLLGQLWLLLWPGAAPGSFAIIGACALLAAATQGPVSAVVLTLELTRRLDTLMVPTILATAGAVFIARLLERRSIYSGRIHLGRVAATRATETPDAIVLSSSARFVELLRAMLDRASEPRPVYVVDETGALVGEVSPAAVRSPSPATLPLETATAADFTHPAAL